MSVNLTVMHAADGAITTTVLSESDKVSALSAAVTSAFNIPAPQQRFLFDNQPLDNAQTLTAAGIKDGDLVVVTAQQQLMPAATSSAGAATGAGAGSGPRSTLPSQPAAGGGDVQLSPEEQTLINQVMNDPMIMGAIRSQLPEMHQRLQNGDPAAGRLLLNYVRNVMMGGGMDMLGGARRAQGQAADGAVQPEVPFDPMSIEGQKAIEERIRQENVNENMHAALEHNPESFGRVVMLFVDCKINTIDGIKAFVDRYVSSFSTSCTNRLCNLNESSLLTLICNVSKHTNRIGFFSVFYI